MDIRKTPNDDDNQCSRDALRRIRMREIKGDRFPILLRLAASEGLLVEALSAAFGSETAQALLSPQATRLIETACRHSESQAAQPT
jgi:hypothetical protein